MVPIAAIAESEVPPTDAFEIQTPQLASSEHASGSPSITSASPSSSIVPHDVGEIPTASSSLNPSAPDQTSAPETITLSTSIAVPTSSTTSDSAVSAATSVAAPAAVPTGVTTPTIGPLVQVGIGLPPNSATIDDIVAAQVEWYLSRANLPTDDFLKSHMDSDLWVSLELILTFPRMVRLGVRDKSGVALLLQARSTDIEVDTKTCRIRPAWALRSHLLLRGVPPSATEADLAALLRIPYVSPPAPDTTSSTIPSPPPDPASTTTTSDSTAPASTATTTDAPHFRGLMSVMQVSMAGEWVAVFAARPDAAVALPHVNGQLVCGQPITAEVFIEGLEPHALPAPSAVYQAVPSYYSHTQAQHALSHIEPHHPHAPHQIQSTLPPSSTVDPSHVHPYQHMAYAQSPRSHIVPHMPPYAPYVSGRARAMSENGDGDDFRHQYGQSQNHGHSHWQRTNGHRVNGHRRGGANGYTSSHGANHSNTVRGAPANPARNDRSRSPSAMSSLSATNATTNRRPRRTARRLTRRGSPGGAPSSQFNSSGYGHSQGQHPCPQSTGNAPTPRSSDLNGNGDAQKALSVAGGAVPNDPIHAEDLIHGNGDPSLASSSVYDRYHEQGNVQRSGQGKGVSTSSAAVVSGGANVAAMDFPPLQPSIAAGSRPSIARVTSKRATSSHTKLSGSGSSESAGEGKSSTDVASLDDDHSATVSGDETRGDTSGLPSSGVENDSSTVHHKSGEGNTPSGNLSEVHTHRVLPGEHDENSNENGPALTDGSNNHNLSGKSTDPSASNSNTAGQEKAAFRDTVDEDHTIGNEPVKGRSLSEIARASPKVQAASGHNQAKHVLQGSSRDGRNVNGNISATALPASNGTVRKAVPGMAATASKSYAAILLSPPRTPRKDLVKQSGNSKQGTKASQQAAKNDARTGGKVNGRVNGVGNNMNGGPHTEAHGPNGRVGRSGSENNISAGMGPNANSAEDAPETAGSSDKMKESKGVRRPPRSPSVWAHKPASVVKAGPAVPVSAPAGHSGSFTKNGRKSSADNAGNGMNFGFRAHAGRGPVHTNRTSHAHSNGGIHHKTKSQGLQQHHAKQTAFSQAHARSQGPVQSQASGPAQTPAASQA